MRKESRQTIEIKEEEKMLIRKVNNGDKEDLQKIADEILQPLYGDQTKALNEWLTGSGFKHAYVLTENSEIVGLLPLKANPNKPYLKISTLVVIEGFRGKGYGKTLLGRAEDFAIENKYSKIIVTVSETKSDSLAFFEGAGFNVIDKKVGRYQKDIAEIILEKEMFSDARKRA